MKWTSARRVAAIARASSSAMRLFPRSAGSGQGEQARRAEQVEHLAQLRLPADERGDRHGQAGGRAGQGRIVTFDRPSKLKELRVRGRGEFALDRLADVLEGGEGEVRRHSRGTGRA